MKKNRSLIKKYKDVNTGEVSLPVCFSRAKGSYIYDVEAGKYLDFTSGYGVTNTGWLREEIVEAITDQLKRSAYAPPWLPSEEAIELSELLLKIVPDNLKKCARATGGADANEIIRKAVYAATGKKGVVSFNRSYHGGTHFNLNISDAKSFHLPAVPSSNDFHYAEPPCCYRCPYGKTPHTCKLECTAAIEEKFQTENIGCLFAEPVLGSGGVIIPPIKYWQKVRDLCTQYNVRLAFDEVLTGFGRLGYMTASELFAIKPDAISFAKGMSSGYAAIGAALLSEELAAGLKKYEDVSSSFAWTPLACAVAKANIHLIIQENMALNAYYKGKKFLQELQNIFQKYLPDNLGQIRGAGLMIGIELVEDQNTKIAHISLIRKFIISSFRKGLMVCASWDFRVIVIMPPLNITDEEIQQGLSVIESVLQEIAGNLSKNNQSPLEQVPYLETTL